MDTLSWVIIGLLCALPFIAYAIIYMTMKKGGSPKWARSWPLMRRVFKTQFLVLERRANAIDPVFTWGRRHSRPDLTEVYQTLIYGDIPTSKWSEVFLKKFGGRLIILLMEENGEFSPVTEVKELEGKELEIEVPDKTDPTKKIKKIVKNYAFSGISQEQKIYYRDAYRESMRYNTKKGSWIDKILPYLPYIIMVFGLLIVTYMTWDGINKSQANTLQITNAQLTLVTKLDDIFKRIGGGGTIYNNYSFGSLPNNPPNG